MLCVSIVILFLFTFCICVSCVFFFFKQKTAYEMRISDWSSDVFASDLGSGEGLLDKGYKRPTARSRELRLNATDAERKLWQQISARKVAGVRFNRQFPIGSFICDFVSRSARLVIEVDGGQHAVDVRSEEHTSELQSLMRISYAVFCL